MRRFVAASLILVILIGVTAFPAFAKEVDGFIVDLYYGISDDMLMQPFAGSTASLDTANNPFRAYISVTLPEEVKRGDYFDLYLTYAGTAGSYTIDQIELLTADGIEIDGDVGFYEFDSTHLSLESMYAPLNAPGSVKIVNITFSVQDPDYRTETYVENGTPIKRFLFDLSVTQVSMPGAGDTGIVGRILSGLTRIPGMIVDGIKNLFLPSEASLIRFKDDMILVFTKTFGPAYDASNLVENFASSLSANQGDTSNPPTLDFPELTVNLAGSDFTFGGWTVRLYPQEFQIFVDILKQVINIVCTLSFANAVKNRLEGLFPL